MANENIEGLREQVEQGGYRDEDVRRFDQVLRASGQWADAGALFEATGLRRENWLDRVWYLGRAIPRFFRVEDYESCVRCHQELLASAPKQLDARTRLLLSGSPGVAMAYARAGQARVAWESKVRWHDAAGGSLSLYEECKYQKFLQNILLEQEQWEDALDRGYRYTEWAVSIAPDDPLLSREPLALQKGTNAPMLVGERIRWWSICFMHGAGTAIAHRKSKTPGERARREMAQAIENLERRVRSHAKSVPEGGDDQEAEWDKAQYVMALYYAGRGAYELRLYDEALRYFRMHEELAGSLYGESPLYVAACLLETSGRQEAANSLRSLRDGRVSDGRALQYFRRLEELATLEHEEPFREILASWR